MDSPGTAHPSLTTASLLRHIEDMRAALRAFVRLGGVRFDHEPGALELLHEEPLGFGGPESHLATGPERALDEPEAAPVVQPRVFALHKGGWSVVDIEEDGVVRGRAGAADDLEDILLPDLDPRVVEQPAIDLPQEFAIPRHHFREQLRHLHFRAATHQFEHALQTEAQAQS